LKIRGKIIFLCEIRGKCIEIAKIGGNSKFVVEDLKKVIRNFGR